MELLRVNNLCVSLGGHEVLQNLNVAVRQGEFTAITGPSGSGKSTLLHAMAGIILPDSGNVVFQNNDLTSCTEAKRSELRLKHMGFVFQNPDMVPELTLLENVMLPLELTGTSRTRARTVASEYLERLGLSLPVIGRRTSEVSGGQAQRAAIARAVATNPSVIFADEPTGALDSNNGRAVLQILTGLVTQNTGVVLVTHDKELSRAADRIVELLDGRIVSS